MSTRTTLPRRPSGVSGGELSHAVAPPRDGNSPSTGSRAGAGVIGNTSLGIGAGTPTGAPIAPARIAASEIRFTSFMFLPCPPDFCLRMAWKLWRPFLAGRNTLRGTAASLGDNDMADTLVFLRRKPPLLRRRGRRLLDQARDHVRVGDERHVARL